MMTSARWATLLVLSIFALAGTATSQSLSVDYSLSPGDKANISYSDPSRAGQTITVDIDDGTFPVPETDSVQITLDAAGNGSTTWDVEDWDQANFNAPGVPTVNRRIS